MQPRICEIAKGIVRHYLARVAALSISGGDAFFRSHAMPIVLGMENVHAANVQQFEKSEDGDNPRCRNAIGTWLCERCGRDVRGIKDACPDVPKTQRWKINFPVQ